jgi:proteasome accessory factor B
VTEVSKEARQFSLILTLISHRFGLRREEILQSVPGYAEKYDPYSDNEQADVLRMFERDKDDIRNLGIVIETLSIEDAWDNNQETRYRISESDYELPNEVTFTGSEMTLLRLAAEAWRGGSLSVDSRHALTKLRSLGIEASDPLVGVAPRINADEPVFEALKDALDRSATVSFMYLKPGEKAPSLRKVAPLALLNRSGTWYVLASDRDKNVERTFLLPRIISTPKSLPNSTYIAPKKDYVAQLEGEIAQLEASQQAQVFATPQSDAAIRLAARNQGPGQSGALSIPYSDLDVLADELCEFGASVRVEAPQELIDAVHQRRRAIAHLHGKAL